MKYKRDDTITIKMIIDQLLVITEELNTVVGVRSVSIAPSKKLIKFVIDANKWRLRELLCDHGVASSAILDSRTNTYVCSIKLE